ncbi:uncharacterized protein [Temnothorax nylanderi]|uniref:uncharacterized protein n=1 Tax=Temnothorax nylanderi TaxID=102681 RepID=UPI003A86A359
MASFIQINLNKSREALDLLIHHANELRAVVCAVSEPARMPGSQQWFRSRNGLAIYINSRIAIYPAILFAQGHNTVIICYGNIYVASCYVSPNIDYDGYSDFLEKLTAMCSSVTSNNLIVCGDFNAHAHLWGSNLSDFKGDLLENWAAQTDLRLVNVGHKPTFVSHQGSSVIDLT